jgi:hypothetical protein
MGKIRDWRVSNSLKDGFRIELVEVPRWTRVLNNFSEYACVATRHLLCSPPEILWKIPLSRTYDHEYELWDRSVASVLRHVAEFAMLVEHHREVVRLSLPISDEVGKDLWGSELRWWEDDEEDDDGRREGSSAGADGGHSSTGTNAGSAEAGDPEAGGSEAGGGI